MFEVDLQPVHAASDQASRHPRLDIIFCIVLPRGIQINDQLSATTPCLSRHYPSIGARSLNVDQCVNIKLNLRGVPLVTYGGGV